MPSILNLKFKGNKSFVPFSNLGDADSLTMTWKVCTKVASFLEQGQRLENLSWRLWHLQNLMVDTDNAKSKREFRKLSKCMGDKLDKEKGRSIEELQAPGFKRNHSTDLIQQRALEREREREASNSGLPGIHRMQFTFSLDAPADFGGPALTQKPDLKPSIEFKDSAARRGRPSTRTAASAACASTEASSSAVAVAVAAAGDRDREHDKPLTQRGRKTAASSSLSLSASAISISSSFADGSDAYALRFPTLFSSDFGPAALLYPAPTLANGMTYGEGLNLGAGGGDGFSIPRPTIELGLDELLSADSPGWAAVEQDQDVDMKREYEMEADQEQEQELEHEHEHEHDGERESEEEHDDSGYSTSSGQEQSHSHTHAHSHSHSHSHQRQHQHGHEDDAAPRGLRRASLLQTEDLVPRTITPSRLGPSHSHPTTSSSASTGTGKRPTLSVRTARAGPSATPVGSGTGGGAQGGGGGGGGNNSAPGGVKAECSNCGATHTPLWRRGLNDELNCNACGLYCKLHKRPRPKSMRNSHGEGRAQAAPRPEAQEVVAQCYNCHTTATPLWRKDDEGKTVCNACGLYYKLHGSPRPISMKSDVIRKRARHDARRGSGTVSETPSASPGASRRASPITDGASLSQSQQSQSQSQSIADSQAYDEQEYGAAELMGAQDGAFSAYYALSYPGPYHPDYIPQLPGPGTLAYPSDGADEEYDAMQLPGEARAVKRRRMSSDSGEEPPSSAGSYGSYESYASAGSPPSGGGGGGAQLEFPFGYGAYGLFGSAGARQMASVSSVSSVSAAYWHPPMLPPHANANANGGGGYVHPPMVAPEEAGGALDFLHAAMHHDEADALFATYLHPPMMPHEECAEKGVGVGVGVGVGAHPPMLPQDWAGYEYHEAMQVY